LRDMAHLDTVNPDLPPPPPDPIPESAPAPSAPPRPPDPFLEQTPSWYGNPFDTREVRKAKERADRAARRADRAARRVQEARDRAAGRQSGASQLVQVAGDAATAALTAVSAAADEAQAKLAKKARMRELESAVVTARAGHPVDVSPPSREEATKLVDLVDPGSDGAAFVRGVGFILAGIAALAMILIGGFGWLGFVVPVGILIAGGSLSNQIRDADRSRKATRIQLELARANVSAGGVVSLSAGPLVGQPVPAVGDQAGTAVPVNRRVKLVEGGDPRTPAEVLAVVDRLIANVRVLVPETVETLQRIRAVAARCLPDDGPLDLADHDTWQVRQICITYLPGALEHYLALPPERASEPLLDGRSARQVLDEQLALIEHRLDEIATRSYQREASGLLSHARFVADTLRPDPFQEMVAQLAANDADPARISTSDQARVTETSVPTGEPAVPTRERA
jgi:hypothetical protein